MNVEIKQPEIKWRGQNINELSLDVLQKLDRTLRQHSDRRGATIHNKRTKKLNINFKQTDNEHFKQLHNAVIVELKSRKKQ